MEVSFFIVFGIVILPIFVLAICLLRGKGAFLIAGYNTLHRDEQAKYDEKALARSVGKFLMGLCLCLMLVPIAIYFSIIWLVWLAIALVVVGSILFVIYANTGNRFRAAEALPREKPKARFMVRIAAITALILIAVGIMVYQGESDTRVSVYDDHFVIEGMYGTRVDFSDIQGIALLTETMREIGTGSRTNGYGGFGDALKGNFRSDALGDILLFVRADSAPTIVIDRASEDIYISLGDSAATKWLYDVLMAVF